MGLLGLSSQSLVITTSARYQDILSPEKKSWEPFYVPTSQRREQRQREGVVPCFPSSEKGGKAQLLGHSSHWGIVSTRTPDVRSSGRFVSSVSWLWLALGRYLGKIWLSDSREEAREATRWSP